MSVEAFIIYKYINILVSLSYIILTMVSALYLSNKNVLTKIGYYIRKSPQNTFLQPMHFIQTFFFPFLMPCTWSGGGKKTCAHKWPIHQTPSFCYKLQSFTYRHQNKIMNTVIRNVIACTGVFVFVFVCLFVFFYI